MIISPLYVVRVSVTQDRLQKASNRRCNEVARPTNFGVEGDVVLVCGPHYLATHSCFTKCSRENPSLVSCAVVVVGWVWAAVGLSVDV